jgi:hypothetical protein
MRKVVIVLDGVLMGLTGLVETTIFTKPIGNQDEKPTVLETMLMPALVSVGLSVVSVFPAMHSTSAVFLLPFLWPAFGLQCQR